MSEVIDKPRQKTVSKSNSNLTTGKIIDSLWELREAKRLLAVQEKDLNAQIEALETQLYERMDAEDTDKAAGKKGSVSLGLSTVFTLDDFDQFTKYVKKTGYFHLFQRRVSDAAVRELFDSGKAVPGLVPFTKRKINLTTIK